MSEAAIREQIAAILASVDGTGVVHQYQRWTNTFEKFLNLFEDENNKINGWCITRIKTPESRDTESGTREYEYKIRGYYGLKDSDATEITFQALIENICDKFRTNIGINEEAEDSDPVQVDIVELRMFGTVLCHFCELTIKSREATEWS